MKDIINLISFLVFLCLLITSCSDSSSELGSGDQIIIEGTQSDIPTFDDNGGKLQINFHAKRKWSVRVSETRTIDWCTVYPLQGEPGDVLLNINIKPNYSNVSRVASIIIKAGLDEKVLDIKQEPKTEIGTIVNFKDEDFKEAVNSFLGKNSSDDIYLNEIEHIEELDISDKYISYMYDLQHFSSLINLTCRDNNFRDLPLTYESMKNLKLVDCSDNILLERIWIYDKTNVLTSPQIIKDTDSHYSILASPNHFRVPRKGANFELFLRPGVKNIHRLEKYNWIDIKPMVNKETKDTISARIPGLTRMYFRLRFRRSTLGSLPNSMTRSL